MTSSISSLDIIIIIIFYVFIIWWALSHRKTADSTSYFLAGKKATWPIIGLSLFAASISSSTLIGHSGEGFISGIAVFNYNLMAVFVMVFFAIFFLPFYIQNGIFTIPEFLGKRFDSRSQLYFSFITIIGNIFLDAAAALYTGALILKMIFPEIDIFWIIIGIGLIAGSYSIGWALFHTQCGRNTIYYLINRLNYTVLFLFRKYWRLGKPDKSFSGWSMAQINPPYR